MKIYLVGGAVRDKLFEESDKVLIVTDSPKDAKEFFATLKNVEISESISDLHDFATLLSSEKLYCAPSTFSWWAARIARTQHPDGIFVAPMYWMGFRAGQWFPTPEIQASFLEYASVDRGS